MPSLTETTQLPTILRRKRPRRRRNTTSSARRTGKTSSLHGNRQWHARQGSQDGAQADCKSSGKEMGVPALAGIKLCEHND
eukprot:9655076-Ditylum_brightwellii.AAC.2